MPTRSKARQRALDILYEAELRGADPLATLGERTIAADPPIRDFTSTLVRTVVEHQAEIDARIVAVLTPGWTLHRMPRIDRNAVRIAVCEIDNLDTPDAVAAAEAVALVASLSTDDSPDFVSGLLGAIIASKAA